MSSYTQRDAILITPSIGRSYHQDEIRVHCQGNYGQGVVVDLVRSINGEHRHELSTELTALEARILAALLVQFADEIDKRGHR